MYDLFLPVLTLKLHLKKSSNALAYLRKFRSGRGIYEYIHKEVHRFDLSQDTCSTCKKKSGWFYTPETGVLTFMTLIKPTKHQQRIQRVKSSNFDQLPRWSSTRHQLPTPYLIQPNPPELLSFLPHISLIS